MFDGARVREHVVGRITALLREVTGALTGDRRTEARGRAEEAAAERGAQVGEPQVSDALREVREEHGDLPVDEGPGNDDRR